mmetsp:Transcript_104122/g.301218  ORF Transcript_104122/g.301218 Transcript_104122/m.301218 type:complete len:328 (-) Transcript_104122:418-1401(-)
MSPSKSIGGAGAGAAATGLGVGATAGEGAALAPPARPSGGRFSLPLAWALATQHWPQRYQLHSLQSMTRAPSSTTQLQPSQVPRFAANMRNGWPCGQRSSDALRDEADDEGGAATAPKMPPMSKPATFCTSWPMVHKFAPRARTLSSACIAAWSITSSPKSSWVRALTSFPTCSASILARSAISCALMAAASANFAVSPKACCDPILKFSAASAARRCTSSSSVCRRFRTVLSTCIVALLTSSEALCACSAACRDVWSMAEAVRAARSTQPGMLRTPSSASMALQKFWQFLWMRLYWFPLHSLANLAVKAPTSCLLKRVRPSGTVVR